MTSGTQLRLRGMRLAASKHKEELAFAQELAKEIAAKHGAITIEVIHEQYRLANISWDLGNAAGSVFAGDEWECVGYTTAKRPEAHGRVIRQWRLRR